MNSSTKTPLTPSTVIDLFETAVQEAGAELRSLPWEKPEAYGAWLTQTYHMVKLTTRFICLAAGNVVLENREGHYDWIGHLKGELNHDLVALRDLKAMNFTPTSFPELVETQLIQQSQFYFLDRGQALGLSGYALFLEGLAAKIGPSLLEKAEAAHGKGATNFLRLHCQVDVDHYAEGLKGLEHMAPKDLEETAKNLAQTQMLYTSMVRTVISHHGRVPLQIRKAA